MRRKTKSEWIYLTLCRVLSYAGKHKFQSRFLVACLCTTIILRYTAPQFIMIMDAWTKDLVLIIKAFKSCL